MVGFDKDCTLSFCLSDVQNPIVFSDIYALKFNQVAVVALHRTCWQTFTCCSDRDFPT